MTNSELAMSRTWAEINLDDLKHNILTLQSLLSPSTKFLGVVKANAYGHGMTQCAHVLQNNGADFLAVATVNEGVTLRQSGITLPILCLGQTSPSLTPLMIQHSITQAVGDFDNAAALSSYAQALNATLKIHIKIDTGMSRTGFYWPITDHSDNNEAELHAAQSIMKIKDLPGLDIEGIFSHFAAADSDENYTLSQQSRFLSAISTLSRLGLNFRVAHIAASSAAISFSDAHMDMARFGLVLYGYESTDFGNENSTLNLHPVMTLKSRITAVRNLPEGTTISYGRTYTLTRDSVIAVLPIGYADGLPRILSNNFNVKIHDKLCPNVGRICMDMCMIDVTDIPDVKPGDIATVWDGELIPIAAKNAGTIIHELLCMPSDRVPRVFIENGTVKA